MDAEYNNMLINLGIVLTFILVVFFVFRKIKFSKNPHQKLVKIINTVPIGSKEKIILIEVNNTQLLVGATPNHIETLHVFKEPEQAHYIQEKGLHTNSEFSDQLSDLIKS